METLYVEGSNIREQFIGLDRAGDLPVEDNRETVFPGDEGQEEAVIV